MVNHRFYRDCWYSNCDSVLVNAVAFVRMIREEYACFEYDNETVKLIARILIECEPKLEECGLSVRCDREMTWICFETITNESSSVPDYS